MLPLNYGIASTNFLITSFSSVKIISVIIYQAFSLDPGIPFDTPDAQQKALIIHKGH